MRARRSIRPALETLSSRIAPSGGVLIPYDNPALAPVIIKDVPPPSVHPLAPVIIRPAPCDILHVGDGNPPPVGDLPVLQA